MGWQDWGDVRRARGTKIKNWPVYEDGAAVAARARVEEKKYRRQIAAEQERQRMMEEARRLKAERDRLKAEAKRQKAEAKREARRNKNQNR